VSGDSGQHPIAADAAAHANRVHTTSEDSRKQSPLRDFQDTCQSCVKTAFSEPDGLRLHELKDKLSKLANVTTDPELKSKVVQLAGAVDRLDTWQLRAWPEIQRCIQTVFDAKHAHSGSRESDQVTLSAQFVPQVKAIDATQRVVKTTRMADADSAMADSREKDASETPFIKRLKRFLRGK
jgi:hypothetical protein